MITTKNAEWLRWHRDRQSDQAVKTKIRKITQFLDLMPVTRDGVILIGGKRYTLFYFFEADNKFFRIDGIVEYIGGTWMARRTLPVNQVYSTMYIKNKIEEQRPESPKYEFDT